MRAGGVDAEIGALHQEALNSVADTSRVAELCDRLQALVHKAGLADVVREPLLIAHRRLGHDAVVAVRSSATGEDGSDASFAGMNATITNVSGVDALLDAVPRPAPRRARCGRCVRPMRATDWKKARSSSPR
jgi:pyruvate, water dikinase